MGCMVPQGDAGHSQAFWFGMAAVRRDQYQNLRVLHC